MHNPLHKTDRCRAVRACLCFLATALVTAAAASAAPTTGAGDAAPFGTHPNVLVILCDDLNAPSEPGGQWDPVPTPNLDRLAESGVRFTNAHSNAPLCAPSRPSFLTGLHPVTTAYYGGTANAQVRHWRDNPRLRRAATLMEHFRNRGYFVCGTGKVFHNFHEDPFVWQDRNGLSQFGHLPSWGPFPWDGVERNYTRPPDVPPHPSTPFVRGMMGYAPLSDVPSVPGAADGPAPGYEGWRLYNRAFRYEGPEDRDLLPDELNARWAAERLREGGELPAEKPFLMVVGMNRPHFPQFTPEDYFDAVPLEAVSLPENPGAGLEDAPPAIGEWPLEGHRRGSRRAFEAIMENGGEAELRRMKRAYLASVAFVDDQIGTILDALAQSPHADNTIIVVTSDHGYHLGDKRFVGKFTLWEESTRVPLIFTGPGIAKGLAVDAPVSLIDLFPTLNDLAGIPNPVLPGERGGEPLPVDGFSLVPFLEGKNEWDGPDAVLTAVGSARPVPPDEMQRARDQHFSLRDRDFRYIRERTGAEGLYDVKADPRETRNLIEDPAYANVLREFRTELQRRVPGL